MKTFKSLTFKSRKESIVLFIILLIFISCYQWFVNKPPSTHQLIPQIPSSLSREITEPKTLIYHHPLCSCNRSYTAQNLIDNKNSQSLCSQYSTYRGLHQRIIAISMYGPKENALFAFNASLNFLHQLIIDMKKIYPNWILRVYHDASIKTDVICPIECIHDHVDFCNTNALEKYSNVNDYIPPKIWRFLPAGDTFVDVMGSRDLDSPLGQRELDAVNEWLSSNKSWHAMRDHPYHAVPMLGGMWGFRPEQNRKFSAELLQKMLDRSLITRYGTRNDQTFLTEQVWPHIQNDVIVHDGFLCTTWYGKNSRPWPTRRPPFNGTDCFVGCVRPCCTPTKTP
ncbi:unnamed protein product, partial [Adineta ricciae]